MKNFLFLLVLFTVLITFNNCTDEPTAPQTNYITFSSKTYSTSVDVGASKTFDITVFTANVTGNDRSFDIILDPTSTAAAASFTLPSTVTIPAGTNEGKLSIALTDTNLGIGVNTLKLSFGAQEGLSIGGTTILSYIQNCTEVTGTLTFAFDAWGSEVGWKITDALDGVVVSKSAGTYADGQVSATESITLCAGRNYTLTITDAFGDGMSDPTNGSYTLTIGGAVKATGGGNYGASQAKPFNTN